MLLDGYREKVVIPNNSVLLFCRNIEDIYEERFICRVDDSNPTFMIPLDDTNVKLFCVSPPYRIKPNKVFVYRRTEKRGMYKIRQ